MVSLTASAVHCLALLAVFSLFSTCLALEFTQKQILNDGSPAVNEAFALGPIALDGDVLVIGSRDGSDNMGAAFIFTRTAGIWSQQQKIVKTMRTASDNFGVAVAVSGETVAIGSREAADSKKGAVYVYTLSGTVWSLEQKVIANDRENFAEFGFSVALEGETLLVGSPESTVGDHSKAGAAYVFTRVGGIWSQQAKLTDPTPGAESEFGKIVALSGDTAVVAAPEHSETSVDVVGLVMVFTRSGTTWTEQQRLKGTTYGMVAYDRFGTAIAVDGDILVVGTRDKNVGGVGRAGTAHVFTRTDSTWTGVEVQPDGTNSMAMFGVSVVVNSGVVYVASVFRTTPVAANSGVVYVYSLKDTTWTLSNTTIVPDATDTQANMMFGAGLAVDGTETAATLIVGSDNPAIGTDVGQAFVFSVQIIAPTSPPDDTNWALIGGIIAAIGVAVVAVVMLLLVCCVAVVGVLLIVIVVGGAGAAFIMMKGDSHDGTITMDVDDGGEVMMETPMPIPSDVVPEEAEAVPETVSEPISEAEQEPEVASEPEPEVVPEPEPVSEPEDETSSSSSSTSEEYSHDKEGFETPPSSVGSDNDLMSSDSEPEAEKGAHETGARE